MLNWLLGIGALAIGYAIYKSKDDSASGAPAGSGPQINCANAFETASDEDKAVLDQAQTIYMQSSSATAMYQAADYFAKQGKTDLAQCTKAFAQQIEAAPGGMA